MGPGFLLDIIDIFIPVMKRTFHIPARVRLLIKLLILGWPAAVAGQAPSLAVLYPDGTGTTSQLLFTYDGAGFSMDTAFTARSADLASIFSQLTVSGDFNGDGHDEIALFGDLNYVPNSHPPFSRPVVEVYRAGRGRVVPAGSWYTARGTGFNLSHVAHAVSGDFNGDGFCDIALFYNDPGSQQLDILMLASDGSSFSEPESWYSCDRNEFNFTAVAFACPGDFNGNGMPDIAVFYNYFGTDPATGQSIFLFESDEESFNLLPSVYDGTKAEHDFSDFLFAFPGDFNSDTYSDLLVLSADPAGTKTQVKVFIGSGTGQLFPGLYLEIPATEVDPEGIIQADAAALAGTGVTDLVLFYSDPSGGDQHILLLENAGSAFSAPEPVFTAVPGGPDFDQITAVEAGDFFHTALVTPATWKDDLKGALTFTFDDGYRGAFENGAEELDAFGIRGTFYIFTDTTRTYDAELAATALVRHYKDEGHEIGSHTVNHSDLGQLTEAGDLDSLSRVLSASVEDLNERFDQQTLVMSIPFGSFLPATLDSIAGHFLSARSSQYGFNLATPNDFHALKSWPVLSTTTPEVADSLVGLAESHGTYFTLMYHDILDGPFNKDSLIYTYLRADFRETLQRVSEREVWIDTHQNIYKYIRQRNGFFLSQVDTSEIVDGHFSFVADDGLADSVFNMELTLLIRLPASWTGDTATVDTGDQQVFTKVISDATGTFVRFSCIPSPDQMIRVYDGKRTATGITERLNPANRVSLQAYPNPFLQETLLQIDGGGGRTGFLILRDMQGRILRQVPTSGNGEIQLHRDELRAGIYVLQLVESGVPVATLKLVAR
jgi:peptidoglycan/xylan/chitin deacetylase (PgdA/CDA1 family)